MNLTSTTCAAEVWAPLATHRCERTPTREIEAHGHIPMRLKVCTQHEDVARRRGMWLFTDDGPSAAVWFSDVKALSP